MTKSNTPKSSVYDIITERITTLLEQGTVPWHKPWKGSGSAAPKNLRSGATYRGINTFLLSCAPYQSPYWLSYKQAADRGGQVKKGEKGMPVVFWKWNQRDATDADGNNTSYSAPILRFYTVFNSEQCDGIDIPAPPTLEVVPEFRPIANCEAVVANMPKAPTITHNEGRACYRRSTDTVSIPRPELFADPAEYYSTLYHELGHATGHETRLDRPGITEAHFFGTCDYSKEELVGEMTACFLCGHCGIESTTLDNSAAYISGWLKQLRQDPRLVVMAGAQAQKASDFILGKTYSPVAPADDTI